MNLNRLQKLILGKDLVEDIENRNRSYSTFFGSGGYFQRSFQEVSMGELLSIPTARKLLEQISGTMASFDFAIYDTDSKLGKVLKSDDYRHKLLNKQSNQFLGAYQWKKIVVTDLICKGHHYSYIKKRGNKILGLYPVDNVMVSYAYDDMGLPIHKVIECTLNNKRIKADYTNFFILENPNGGVLSNAQVLRQLLSERNAMSEALENGSYVDKYLSTEGRLSQQTLENLKNSWDANYSGNNRSKRTLLLEEGMELKAIPNDNSLISAIESWSKRELSQISLLFGLPNTQTLESVNVSVKQLGTLLLQQVYMPMVEHIENEIERQLLLESEKGRLIVELDTTSLVRLDETEKAELYTNLFKQGVISKNQLNDMLLLPREEHDYYNHTLASVLVYKDEVDKESIVDRTLVMNTLATEQQNKVEEEQQEDQEQNNFISNDNEEDQMKDKEKSEQKEDDKQELAG